MELTLGYSIALLTPASPRAHFSPDQIGGPKISKRLQALAEGAATAEEQFTWAAPYSRRSGLPLDLKAKALSEELNISNLAGRVIARSPFKEDKDNFKTINVELNKFSEKNPRNALSS